MARRVVILDSGVLGLILYSRGKALNWRCHQWMRALLQDGVPIAIPEIIDYELRRELLRTNQLDALRMLAELNASLLYEPLTTAALRLAAQLWAEARQRGRPTAGERSLDIDVILAAQARVIEARGQPVIVATTNVKHLSRYVAAEDWETIAPA